MDNDDYMKNVIPGKRKIQTYCKFWYLEKISKINIKAIRLRNLAAEWGIGEMFTKLHLSKFEETSIRPSKSVGIQIFNILTPSF